MLTKVIDKAGVLIEAMPYIQRFRGEKVVVKVGGSTMEDPTTSESILTDISFMACMGMHPVIVHGGGKAITAAMKKENIQAQFIGGLRVTDLATIRIVEKVLATEISPEIMTAIKKKGMKAQVLPGTHIIRCIKHWESDPKTGEKYDIGFVGDIISVNPLPIDDMVKQDIIPVISPLGLDDSGNIYNNNADIAAGEIAIAIRARKLVFISDVHGIMRNPGDMNTFIPSIHSSEVNELIHDKVISGGMLPKVNAGIKAVQSGVTKTHIIDGNLKHSLLLEIFTDQGIGTEIIG